MSNKMLTLMMGFVAFLILAVGLVFVIALSGGGGDDDDSPAGGDGTPRPSTSGKICDGKSLIVPGEEPSEVLDPILVGTVSTAEYVVEIFGGLVYLDPDLEVQADIAKEWSVSNGGKTYTFKLRDNVVFHSGTARRVTANDFKYSIERAADATNGSPTAVAYLGNIVGLKERYQNKASSVSGVKVIDDLTVQIDLVEPSDFFLKELTYPVAYVVDKEQIEKDKRNWTQKPRGTGPFQVKEFKAAEKIVLVKNERYHLGVPKLDEVVFELAGGNILTRYENDEVHVGFFPTTQLESVKSGQSPLSPDYREVPEMAVFYFNLNPQKAPFDDIKVRQAFAMTVDRANINTVLLYDALRVADGFMPPEVPGYTESVKSYPYDPNKAKQLLQESKYAGKLPRVVLSYGGAGGAPADTLVAMQKNWQDILGVEIELQAIDASAFLREARKGQFQMQADGWSADYPDPEDFLGKLFASDSTLNYTKYNNAEVDALLKQAKTEQDRTKRYSLYAQAEQKILDDAIVIPTFWSVSHALVKPCVKDYPAAPLVIPKYRYVDIKDE